MLDQSKRHVSKVINIALHFIHIISSKKNGTLRHINNTHLYSYNPIVHAAYVCGRKKR